jgi:hypothetical protein
MTTTNETRAIVSVPRAADLERLRALARSSERSLSGEPG